MSSRRISRNTLLYRLFNGQSWAVDGRIAATPLFGEVDVYETQILPFMFSLEAILLWIESQIGRSEEDLVAQGFIPIAASPLKYNGRALIFYFDPSSEKIFTPRRNVRADEYTGGYIIAQNPLDLLKYAADVVTDTAGRIDQHEVLSELSGYRNPISLDQDDFNVTVRTAMIFHESSTNPDQFYHAYEITQSMRSDAPPSSSMRLQRRYWKIDDLAGNVDEVDGPGVIGQHPVLTPGKSTPRSMPSVAKLVKSSCSQMWKMVFRKKHVKRTLELIGAVAIVYLMLEILEANTLGRPEPAFYGNEGPMYMPPPNMGGPPMAPMAAEIPQAPPAAPMAPVEPPKPIVPVAPAAPAAPIVPVNPAVPAAPVAAAVPAAPVAPAVPAAPAAMVNDEPLIQNTGDSLPAIPNPRNWSVSKYDSPLDSNFEREQPPLAQNEFVQVPHEQTAIDIAPIPEPEPLNLDLIKHIDLGIELDEPVSISRAKWPDGPVAGGWADPDYGRPYKHDFPWYEDYYENRDMPAQVATSGDPGWILPMLYFDMGPNNLFRLLRQGAITAYNMGRGLTVPVFHRHPRMGDTAKNPFVLPIFDQNYTVDLVWPANETIDVGMLRKIMPVQPMKDMMNGCQKKLDLLIKCGDIDDKRYQGINHFQRAIDMEVAETVTIPTMADLDPKCCGEACDANQPAKMDIADKKCVGIVYGKKKVIGNRPYLFVHWRYESDWLDMCKPSRPKGARERNKEICKLIMGLTYDEGTRSMFVNNLKAKMAEYNLEVVYLASPPNNIDLIRLLNSSFPGNFFYMDDVGRYSNSTGVGL
ncbi:Oidioi.mRNA.OKI2018_I69.PAR.g11805.t3.cds [Oikopleura dioica]|uniref:Oidioi.mRNA.OKI2018_I69.PAR.g11805.t3.cds n=1 Tax=Oikopleura dioica TaxID=34765 RepID=A0ABN7S0F0_OIKDI|nr:Oidioi.mRNA.OKI2018_I69.PAR.g11805.t3.cds [Oikopleura dioica]